MMAVCADNANYYWNAGDSLLENQLLPNFEPTEE